MPKGVEHKSPASATASAMLAQGSVMPKGVEHQKPSEQEAEDAKRKDQ